MNKVFIGGSRRVSRLAPAVRARLDQIVEKRLAVLVGDANGADKAVQLYFKSRGYDQVEVFCTGANCRNNVGNWKTRAIPAPSRGKDFAYYAAKDEAMAREASLGLMLWDGKSMGTLANVFRLVEQSKRTVVYVSPAGRFMTLKSRADWDSFLAACPAAVRDRIHKYTSSGGTHVRSSTQLALF